MSRPLFQLLYCQFPELPALLTSGHAPSGWPPILGKSTLHFLSSCMRAAGEEPNRVDLPSHIHYCCPWILDHLSDVFGQLVLRLSVVADPSLLQSSPTPSFPTSSQSLSRPPAFVLHREQTQLGRNLSTTLLSKPRQSWFYQTSLTTSVPSGLPSLLFCWELFLFLMETDPLSMLQTSSSSSFLGTLYYELSFISPEQPISSQAHRLPSLINIFF